jgi:hypothetical protein
VRLFAACGNSCKKVSARKDSKFIMWSRQVLCYGSGKTC